MRGELDFGASTAAHVALLEDLPTALDRVRDQVELAPGARTLVRTLKRLGYQFAIVIGGFTQVTDDLVADLASTTSPPTPWRSSTVGSPAGSWARWSDRQGKADA